MRTHAQVPPSQSRVVISLVPHGGLGGVIVLSFLSATHLLQIILRIGEITIAFARKVSVEATADKALFPGAACSYGNWQPSAVTIGHYL